MFTEFKILKTERRFTYFSNTTVLLEALFKTKQNINEALLLYKITHKFFVLTFQRAINSEDVMETTTKETKKICADTTPCAWSIYKPITKIIEYNLENT